MKQVRFIRPKANFIRTMRVSDFKAMGIGGAAQDLSWSAKNRWTVEMSDEMSDSLVGKLPNEFIALEFPGRNEAPPIPEGVNESDSSELETPEAIPDESEEQPARSTRSSTRKKKPDA